MTNEKNNRSMITVAKAAQQTNVPLSIIKKYADSKYNRPLSFKEKIIAVHEIEEYMRDVEEYIGLYYYLKSMARNNSKVDFSYSRCRREAIAYLERNEWFGTSVLNAQDLKYNIDVREEYYLKNTEVSFIDNRWTQLWIDGYGKSDSERIILLVNAYSEKFPFTTARYLSFAEEYNSTHKKPTLQLLDYLLYVLKKEIFDYTDLEIEQLVKHIGEEISGSTASLFLKYLDSVIKTHPTKFINRFKVLRKKKETEDPPPYLLENYTKMASIVFGKESWKKTT